MTLSAGRNNRINEEIKKKLKRKLHKLHSNIPELQSAQLQQASTDETTYAKQQFGATTSETTIFGLSWDKNLIKVQIPTDMSHSTKREVLDKKEKIYDPLGLVSQVMLQAKLLFRDCCDAKLSWDEELSQQLKDEWSSLEKDLPRSIRSRFPGNHQRNRAAYLC